MAQNAAALGFGETKGRSRHFDRFGRITGNRLLPSFSQAVEELAEERLSECRPDEVLHLHPECLVTLDFGLIA